MNKVNIETVREFIADQLNGDMKDFGYLLIPEDARLNDEALSYIKKSFSEFIKLKEQDA